MLTATVSATAVAQSEDEPTDVFARFRKEAEDYKMINEDTKTVVPMKQQSLLNWNNPARNGETGSVFLWTDNDRPVAIGTCFIYTYDREERRKHAFHILCDDTLNVAHRDRPIWNPKAGGVVFKKLPAAPTPGINPAQRNRQLRSLARQFEVTVTQKNGRKEQCRLVPQPLYRYESADGTNVGAIFSFAVGTDPEALLLLNVANDADGQPAWHYGFARFTFYPLEAKIGEESVWNVEQSESLTSSILARRDYQQEPYITFRAEWLD
ncbi:MAG: hypothetical protein R3C59_12450 [Planctomycetaceae bacterium]